MPPFILATDETFTATIAAFYGTEKGVTGNGTARVFGKIGESQDWILLVTEPFLLVQKKFYLFDQRIFLNGRSYSEFFY